MSTRREAREYVMQALYAYAQASQADVRPVTTARHHVHTLLEPRLADDPAALDFAQRLFTQAVDRRDEIDALITRHTKNWAMHRIALVDLSVMRMAVAELLTFEDVPPKATIDEAIEIVKQYSTPKSGPFVNGVLDAALIDLEREGRLHKAGRGLVGIESIRRRAGTLESASS